MDNEPKVVNRVPEETPKPAVKKPSDLVFKLLRFLCSKEIIGKREVLKDRAASFGGKKFKIEQGSEPSSISLYLIDKAGRLSRPFGAREAFMIWEENNAQDFGKLAVELFKKEKIMVTPIKYEKGDYKRMFRVRAALGEPEKRWLTTRLTPSEQLCFLQQHELWNDKKEGDET